jgi:hypothetical protein
MTFSQFYRLLTELFKILSTNVVRVAGFPAPLRRFSEPILAAETALLPFLSKITDFQ